MDAAQLLAQLIRWALQLLLRVHYTVGTSPAHWTGLGCLQRLATSAFAHAKLLVGYFLVGCFPGVFWFVCLVEGFFGLFGVYFVVWIGTRIY